MLDFMLEVQMFLRTIGLLTLCLSRTAAADVAASQVVLDETLKIATARNRAVLVEFSAVWC
ncbi:MAG: hypothetical protein JWO36_3549, partial [Myxococcales bacterium]|nr:hypothetical protein [Myxococcales bacterium]